VDDPRAASIAKELGLTVEELLEARAEITATLDETVVGGLVFGLVEILAQSNSHIGAGFSNAIAFGLMVLVVVIRPRGIMGRLSGTAPGV